MSTSSTFDQMKESYLFRGVSDQDRRALLDLMQPRTLEPDTILFNEGDPGDSMFVILKGKIHIFLVDDHHHEIPLRDFEPIRTLGEFAMLDDRPRSATGRVVLPTEVLELKRKDFLDFVQTRPLVGLSMMRDLVERVRYTTEYVQRVMNATTQLSQGNYAELVNDAPESEQDEQIGNLIRAFMDMVHRVQDRENSLKLKAPGE